MTTATRYKVTVSHPTNFHSGVHTVVVHQYEETKYEKAHFTCSGSAFGYSRNYFVKTPKEAISRFLAEHACSVVKVIKAR